MPTSTTSPTLAIVGAGPGTGAAVARRFGAEGFAVALVARSQSNLEALSAELAADGVAARGFAADVAVPEKLSRALAEAAEWNGPVEVLQYSPIPHPDFLKSLDETSEDDIRRALDFSLHGPMTAVSAVLPGMRSLGRCTIVFVNGGSAVRPNPRAAGTSIAFAAEAAYAQLLHDSLAPQVHVAQLVVPGAISPDRPDSSPAAIAERIWQLHTDRDGFRTFQTPMPDEG